MKRRARGPLPPMVELFLEYLIAAAAEAFIAAIGWVLRKTIRRWRKKKKAADDAEAGP